MDKAVTVPSTSFKSVMESKDLAPLVLQHLDFKSLVAYSSAGRLAYQRAHTYHWGKRLIEEDLLAYYLLEHDTFQHRLGDPVLRSLYLLLRNNRRFAVEELSHKSKNHVFNAVFGELNITPFFLAALVGRVDILMEIVERNKRYVSNGHHKMLSCLLSQTKHGVSFYLVYGQHFNKLSDLIASNHIDPHEIHVLKTRQELLFAGGCAGMIDIAEKLGVCFHKRPLQLTNEEKNIVASGFIVCGHLLQLQRYTRDNDLSIISILRESPECLHYAAQNGHREIVNLILSEIEKHNKSNKRSPKKQFFPIEFDSNKRSLLHYFAFHGWEDEFLELSKRISVVKKKIRLSPTQLDVENNTPMHFAVRGGRLSMVRLCEKRKWGKLSEIMNKYQDNALGFVIEERKNHLIDILLDQHNMDCNIVNLCGHNLLMLCANSDNWDAFTQLSPRFINPLSSCTRSGWTLAHVAAFQGNIRFLRHLKIYCLERGRACYEQLFRSVTEDEDTILHKACESHPFIGYIKILTSEFDCDIRKENKHKENPLHTILLRKDKYPDMIWAAVFKIVEYYGVDLLQTKNRRGQTLLEIANDNDKAHLFAPMLGLDLQSKN